MATERGPQVDCPLCSDALAPVIAQGEHWKVVLNRNQNLLGKTLLVLHRHEEQVTRLTEREWHELHVLLDRVTRAITATFAPHHFNYAFLQNLDRHVHLHAVPRYATRRTVLGERFVDSTWPDHYAVGETVVLSDSQLADLARELADAW